MPLLKHDRIKAWTKEYKAPLAKLAGSKLLEGLMALLAAWELSRIVSGIFLEHMPMAGAAPHFAVLLFSMFAKSFGVLQEKAACRRISCRFRLQLREKLQDAMLRQKEFSPSGQFQAAAMDAVDKLDDFFRHVLPLLFSAGILLPLYFLVMLPVDAPTALLFFLTLPIAPFLLFLIGRVTKNASQKQWQEMLRLQKEFSELLQGLFTLKLFRQETAQKSALGKLCRAFSHAALQVLQIAFISAFALELITTLSIALIAVSIGLRLLAGHMEFDCAFFALLLAPEFYHPLRQGGTAFHIAMDCRTAWDCIQSCLKGTASPKVPRRRDRIQHPPAIRVENLSFCFEGRIHPVLHHLSFTLDAGSFTVLAGASGSGKSTLLRLLGGNLSPTQGRILLNEFPLDEIDPDDRPRHIAYVPQEPHVFAASLRDNVALFRPWDDGSIRSALGDAGLGAWLSGLPRGLDTLLGSGGIALSNGQRHRLGLARAILQDAPVVLLDEVTAGLDEETEGTIIAFLKDFSYRRTILLASHRPAVLRAFPRILRLDGGHHEG